MSNERAGSMQVRVLAESPAAFSAEHTDEAVRLLDKVTGRLAPVADGLVHMRGIFGTALFYSDGMITPTISVPPTVGGVKVAESSLERWAVLINVAILLAPFMLSLTNRGS